MYRPPNTDVEIFNNAFAKVVHQIKSEHKSVFILGDFNVNLLEIDDHIPSSEFLELMYSNSLLPLITKPTRKTHKTSTLIDNIFTNHASQSKISNGILFTDVSDHFPIFSILCNHVNNDDNTIKRRIISEKAIKKFTESLSACEWNNIYDESDGRKAFSSFYKTFGEIYNNCFPVRTCKNT